VLLKPGFNPALAFGKVQTEAVAGGLIKVAELAGAATTNAPEIAVGSNDYLDLAGLRIDQRRPRMSDRAVRTREPEIRAAEHGLDDLVAIENRTSESDWTRTSGHTCSSRFRGVKPLAIWLGFFV
jgi:hypothetical protein